MNNILPVCACLLTASPLVASTKPNIVFILADDMGWQDAGFAGAKYYETPVLDRLAAEGMVFRQAYAPAANCVPSRACLISGQYVPRHGVFSVGETERGPAEKMRLKAPPGRSGLSAEDTTLAKAMKAAGYTTGTVGKWHLDGATGSPPAAQGFDVIEVSAKAWAGADPKDPKAITSITSAACDFLQNHKDRPFFLYVAHYAPHSPLQAKPETIEHFKSKAAGDPTKNAAYAACVSDMDTGIGVILEKLKSLGLEDNTLVVFSSDNGGTHTDQEPLRGSKGSYFEGGVRVPTAMRWPGVIKPGTTCDVPISLVDLYPTFVSVAGGTPAAERALDGEDLSPLFKQSGDLARSAIFWHFPGYLNRPVPRGRDKDFRTRPVSVIRKGDWKLFFYHEEWQLDGGKESLATNRAVELYNIQADPGEHTDLALKETAKRDELLDDLLSWFTTTKAPLPTPRPATEKGSEAGKKTTLQTAPGQPAGFAG